MTKLVRIIPHWSVTNYKASENSKKHYHFLYEGNGNVVDGKFKPEANAPCRKGRYAAHTLGTNTGSIGVAFMAMRGARSPKNFGDYPIKEGQFEAGCRHIASLCRKYKIAVTDTTVLTHAEVEKNLGRKQRGKWDIAVLPHVGLVGAKACGDYLRQRVRFHLTKTVPVDDDSKRIQWLQKLLVLEGYDLIPDGRFGPVTKGVIEQFEVDNGIPVTGSFDTRVTVDLLKASVEADAPMRNQAPPEMQKFVEHTAAVDRNSTEKPFAIGVGLMTATATAKEVADNVGGVMGSIGGFIPEWFISVALVAGLAGGAFWYYKRVQKQKAAKELL